MKTIKTILIFGASGSGSTTLARALESRYDYHLIDTDDAIWEKSDPPFSIRKTNEEAYLYLIQEFQSHDKNVISGSIVSWGDELKNKIDLFIYMHLPLNIRLERIQKREENRFKNRVLPGGDLYLQHLDFLDWVSQYETLDVSSRSMKQHLAWLKDVKKPIVIFEDELSIDELIEKIKEYLE